MKRKHTLVRTEIECVADGRSVSHIERIEVVIDWPTSANWPDPWNRPESMIQQAGDWNVLEPGEIVRPE